MIFWSYNEKTSEDPSEKSVKYAFLKRFNVFNLKDTTLENLPSETPKRQEVEQIRQSVLNFARNNYKRIANHAKGDGADFNRFLAFIGAENSQALEIKAGNFCDNAKNALVGELVNLFICAKGGLNFQPIFKDFAQEWAELLDSQNLDFLKCAKNAKTIAEEMLTWQNLARIESRPLAIMNSRLLSA